MTSKFSGSCDICNGSNRWISARCNQCDMNICDECLPAKSRRCKTDHHTYDYPRSNNYTNNTIWCDNHYWFENKKIALVYCCGCKRNLCFGCLMNDANHKCDTQTSGTSQPILPTTKNSQVVNNRIVKTENRKYNYFLFGMIILMFGGAMRVFIGGKRRNKYSTPHCDLVNAN